MCNLSGQIASFMTFFVKEDNSVVYHVELDSNECFTLTLFEGERSPVRGDNVLVFLNENRHAIQMIYDVPVEHISFLNK